MIRILTLNLRLQMAMDGIHSFSNRKDGLVRCLETEKPDVMGFQEMTPEMLLAMREGLPAYSFVGERNRASGKTEYTAIGYRKETLVLEKVETFWLSHTPGVQGSRFPLQSPDPRTCTWAVFRHVHTGIRFRYFNTHLDHLSPPARAKGLRIIFQRMAEIQAGERLPFFFGGDFNFTPTSVLYKACLLQRMGGEPLVDLTRGLPTTFHWFGKLRRPFKLDYVFCGADTAQSMMDVRILRYNDDGGFLSDHDAVAMVWSVGAPPAPAQ